MAPGSQMWLFFTFLPLFCCEFNNSGFDFLFWLQNRDGNVSLFSDVAQKINCDTNGEINYRLKINELQLWLKVFTFKKVASRNNLEEQRSAGRVFFFFFHDPVTKIMMIPLTDATGASKGLSPDLIQFPRRRLQGGHWPISVMSETGRDERRTWANQTKGFNLT